MKRSFTLVVLVCTVILCMVGCDKANYGSLKGMQIFVTNGKGDVSVQRSTHNTSRSDGGGVQWEPGNIKIGINKVWFPVHDTYFALANNSTLLKDRSQLPTTGFFKAIDQYIEVDASTASPMRIEVLPEYGMTYYGMLADVVFYEFEMEDFSLRWYGQDYGNYKARDVLIKKPGETTWKYPYFHRASDGTLTFVILDTRQPTKSTLYLNDNVDGGPNTEDCYISIVDDGLGDGPSGIPDRFEPYLYPLLIPGGGKDISDPNLIEIFSRDKNEAQYYLLQIDLGMKCDPVNHPSNGLGIEPMITTNLSGVQSLRYAQWMGIINENLNTSSTLSDPNNKYTDGKPIYTSVVPVGAGIDMRFGWMDFDNQLQGGFSPNAGW